MTERTGRLPFGNDLVRSYRYVCLVVAVVGVAGTIWASTWDPLVAGSLAALTLLLLPTYLLVRRRFGRREA